MSQSSQESENLLSPLLEPVSVVRGAQGLLAVAGDPSPHADDNICSTRDEIPRSANARHNKFETGLDNRISIEAQLGSAKRRKSPAADRRTDKDQAVVSSNWRSFTKSYKSNAVKSNVMKYFRGNATKEDSIKDSEPNSAENKMESNPSPKRPSDEFKETYLPYAKSRKSKEAVDAISKNMQEAIMLNKEIEVPKDEGGDRRDFFMSQLTMVEGGTQAFDGGRDSDEDEEEQGLKSINEGEEMSSVKDVSKSQSFGGKQKENVEQHQLQSAELDSEHLAVDTPACELLLDKPNIKRQVFGSLEDETSAQSGAFETVQDKPIPTDEFEFEPDEIILDNKLNKPLPAEVAAAAKKRKKSPTDKALLEETNFEISQKSSQNNILVNQNESLLEDDVDEFNDAAPDFEPESAADEPEKQPKPSFILPPKQTKYETIRYNYAQMENIGKALSCPICCHSLKSSTFLPCGHAFCHDCLSDAFRNSGSNPSCPVCRLSCSRRSGTRIQQLDEIVSSYKGLMRAFAFTPVVHSKQVGMTQLSPGDDCLEGDEEEGERRTGREFKKKRTVGVDEALEHHQIAQTNHEAFASFQKQAPATVPAVQKSSGNRITREELERQNLARRYQLLAADQAAVMHADQEALEKVTKKKKVAEATLEFAKIGQKNEYDDKPVGEDTELIDSRVDKGHNLPGMPEESQDTFYTASKSDGERAGKNELFSASRLPVLPPIESQDTFHTAKSGYSTETNQHNRSSIETTQSPTILHDGNTAKKAKAVDHRESLATAASTIVLHDGNTAQKRAECDRTPRRSGRHLPFLDEGNDRAQPETAAPKNNGGANEEVEFGGVLSQQSSVVSEDSDRTNGAVEPVTSSKEEIQVGSVVMVQPRTWPGINKHGGVGRVTKVDSSSSRGSKKYDITYILGGKEKGVDEIYVSLNEAEQSDSADLTVGARVSRSAEKAARPKRKRDAKASKNDPVSQVPVYNDDELEHIPADVLEWAGIVRPKNKAVSKAAAGKKRVLAESSGNVAPKNAKKKKAAKKHSPATNEIDNRSSISFQDAIEKLTNGELVRYADSRYSSLLSFGNVEAVTLNIVTSSLSEQDTKQLTSLIKMLKENRNVTLKIMKDFKPGKTQLCITSASADASSEQNVVSKSRTLKVMRSALLGLPILTPRWVEACIEETRVVAPTGEMCVRSLPRKTAADDNDLASFGVAKYAAAAGQTGSKVLSNCLILMCGKWKASGQSILKDLKILLEDAGATLINSVTSASKLLTDESGGRVILLCDDSHIDADCGVSNSLHQAVKCAIVRERRVLIVHYHWLFDCVSCATFMKGTAYEPLAPRTKELWTLFCDCEESK